MTTTARIAEALGTDPTDIDAITVTITRRHHLHNHPVTALRPGDLVTAGLPRLGDGATVTNVVDEGPDTGVWILTDRGPRTVPHDELVDLVRTTTEETTIT